MYILAKKIQNIYFFYLIFYKIKRICYTIHIQKVRSQAVTDFRLLLCLGTVGSLALLIIVTEEKNEMIMVISCM